MERISFFAPDGKKELTKEQFVDLYNEAYFLNDSKIIKGLAGNSRWIEENIDIILKNGIKSCNDVLHILAWKKGKIKHGDSETEKRFVYHSDWKDLESFDIRRYGKEVDTASVKNFVDFVYCNIDRMQSMLSNGEEQSVINQLRDNSYSDIGTVFLITMLYFISQGELPIYDKFAQIAVYAIAEGKHPGEKIKYSDLPTKDSRSFNTVMSDSGKYKTYVRNLNRIFGEEYKTNRNIDRALWVYGHLFDSKGLCR